MVLWEYLIIFRVLVRGHLYPSFAHIGLAETIITSLYYFRQMWHAYACFISLDALPKWLRFLLKESTNIVLIKCVVKGNKYDIN